MLKTTVFFTVQQGLKRSVMRAWPQACCWGDVHQCGQRAQFYNCRKKLHEKVKKNNRTTWGLSEDEGLWHSGRKVCQGVGTPSKSGLQFKLEHTATIPAYTKPSVSHPRPAAFPPQSQGTAERVISECQQDSDDRRAMD